MGYYGRSLAVVRIDLEDIAHEVATFIVFYCRLHPSSKNPKIIKVRHSILRDIPQRQINESRALISLAHDLHPVIQRRLYPHFFAVFLNLLNVRHRVLAVLLIVITPRAVHIIVPDNFHPNLGKILGLVIEFGHHLLDLDSRVLFFVVADIYLDADIFWFHESAFRLIQIDGNVLVECSVGG